MARYHVNPKTGNPGLCAAKQSCPFGSLDSDHYDSSIEAREAYEKSQASSLLPPNRSQLVKAFNELRGQASILSVEINDLETQFSDLNKAIPGLAALSRLGRLEDADLLAALKDEREAVEIELDDKREFRADLNRRINEIHSKLDLKESQANTSGLSYTRKGGK